MTNLFQYADIFLCVFLVMDEATHLLALASTCKAAWSVYKNNEDKLLDAIAKRNNGYLVLSPEPRILHGQIVRNDAFWEEKMYIPYVKGKTHGTVILESHCVDGKADVIMESDYVNGVLHGCVVFRTISGGITSLFYYENGLAHGPVIHYRPDGTMVSYTEYVNGMKHGMDIDHMTHKYYTSTVFRNGVKRRRCTKGTDQDWYVKYYNKEGKIMKTYAFSDDGTPIYRKCHAQPHPRMCVLQNWNAEEGFVTQYTYDSFNCFEGFEALKELRKPHKRLRFNTETREIENFD
jgi:hypothetical protein